MGQSSHVPDMDGSNGSTYEKDMKVQLEVRDETVKREKLLKGDPPEVPLMPDREPSSSPQKQAHAERIEKLSGDKKKHHLDPVAWDLRPAVLYNPHRQKAIHLLAQKFSLKENFNEDGNWTVAWLYFTKSPTFWKDLKANKRVNFIRGISDITKKKKLTASIKRAALKSPGDYDFYSQSWILPSQFNNLKLWAQKNMGGGRYLIVKPDKGLGGQGITMTNKIRDIDPNADAIVQVYLDQPLLLTGGLKFDMRIYALITSVNPLRIYVHDEGFARFCTIPYECPNKQNSNSMQHLTNYSLNKNNDSFIKNKDTEHTDVGHKWSLGSLRKRLREKGYDVEAIWKKIHRVIVNTILTIKDKLVSCNLDLLPRDLDGGMCYQFLGFDIMLDQKAKPWLIEVNRYSSINCDTPVDEMVNVQALGDLLRIVNPSADLPKNHHKIFDRPPVRSSPNYSEWLSDLNRKKRAYYAIRIKHETAQAATSGYTLVYPPPQSRKDPKSLPPGSQDTFKLYSPAIHTNYLRTLKNAVGTNSTSERQGVTVPQKAFPVGLHLAVRSSRTDKNPVLGRRGKSQKRPNTLKKEYLSRSGSVPAKLNPLRPSTGEIPGSESPCLPDIKSKLSTAPDAKEGMSLQQLRTRDSKIAANKELRMIILKVENGMKKGKKIEKSVRLMQFGSSSERAKPMWRIFHHGCSRLATLQYRGVQRIIRFRNEVEVILQKAKSDLSRYLMSIHDASERALFLETISYMQEVSTNIGVLAHALGKSEKQAPVW